MMPFTNRKQHGVRYRAKQRNKASALVWITTLVVLSSQSLQSHQVAAFSAHLSRPWEHQAEDHQRSAVTRLAALKHGGATNTTSNRDGGLDDGSSNTAVTDSDADKKALKRSESAAAASLEHGQQTQPPQEQKEEPSEDPVLSSSSDIDAEVPAKNDDTEDAFSANESIESTATPLQSRTSEGELEAPWQPAFTPKTLDLEMINTSPAPIDDDSQKQVAILHSASTSSSMATTTTTTTAETPATIRSCLPDLIQMTRPINDPGVVLFHGVGIWLALATLPNASMSMFWKVALHPSMMIVLVALLLTSSTSMLVNDYYDTKLGNDSHKPYQPLKDHLVPMNVAKRFLSMLYAAALVCTTCVPGIPARLSVMTGLILTFWYTQHLKPKTWLKNGVCASLIALAPFTSGMATLSLLEAGALRWGPLTPLLRLVALLFVGILGREISMDLNDRIEDKHHGVWTVPVVYGPKFASQVSFICSAGVSALAMSAPLRAMIISALAKAASTETAAAAAATISWAGCRRLGLAVVGSIMQLHRAYQVLQVEGRDKSVVEKAVDESLLSVVVLLASFI